MITNRENAAETNCSPSWFSRICAICRHDGLCAALISVFFKTWKNPQRGSIENGVVLQYMDAVAASAVVSGFISQTLFAERGTVNPSLVLVSQSERHTIALRPVSSFLCFGQEISGRRFHIQMGSLPYGEYHAEILAENGGSRRCPFAVGPRFPLSFHYRNQWVRLSKDKAMRMKGDGSFVIFRPILWRRVAFELGLLAELLVHRTFPEWLAIPTRLAYFVWRPFHKGRYWIFSDKLSNPIDSAYSVAKALVFNREFEAEHVVPYYLVDGRHSLRVKLPSRLKTVRYLSLRHRLLFLAAEASVTSEGGYVPLVPPAPYADLIAHQLRIWTTHGIVHHDLSRLYGRDCNNFNLMITGVEREAEYERGGLWGYAREDVVCTGLSRWDDRETKPEKKIYFVFTWRNNLVEDTDPITKERKYGALLDNSEYKARLLSLMSNPQLRALSEKYGYTLEFLPHPLMRSALSFFTFPDYVHIVPENVPYEDIYRDASIAVTDYSSIAMDMAYLGKPVAYYQFDHDEFYATQGYTESFFSWKDDGFGPVLREESGIVEAIGEILARSCVREPEYERRAQAFFPRRDKENGLRVCRAIFEKIKRCQG